MTRLTEGSDTSACALKATLLLETLALRKALVIVPFVMTYKVVIRGYVQITHDVFMRHPRLKGLSPGSTPASTTAAWAHLRALRGTSKTCHGSPDLGEGSSRAHTCTTCPWNAKRKRQDYGCTCMCGDSRGCPTSSGYKLYVHIFTNVPSTLSGVIAWKRFEGVTVFCYLAGQRACHVEGACEGRHYMTTGQQWEGVNDVVSTYRELAS